MSAHAIDVSLPTRAKEEFFRPRDTRATSHPPDVLEQTYVTARKLPPLIAGLTSWAQLHSNGITNTHALVTATITIRHLVVFLLLMGAWECAFHSLSTHRRATPRSQFILSQIRAVLVGTSTCVVLLWMGRFLFRSIGLKSISLTVFALRCGVSGLLCVLAAAALYDLAYQFSLPQIYVIVGSRRRAVDAYKRLKSNRERRSTVLGFIDSDSSHSQYLPCDYLGSLDKLEKILVGSPVEMVHVVLPIKSQYADMQRAIWTCERLGVKCSCPVDVFETTLGSPCDGSVRDLKGCVYRMVHEDYRVLVKRVMDIVLTLLLLLMSALVMLAVALAIKLTSPGPVFFVQERYGRNRSRFRMYKFRSMVINAEELQKQVEDQNEASGPMFKIKKDSRVTPVGRVLRKLSLDELPQFFNVLKGDMSLVGPRPMSVRDVHLFSEAQLMRRFSVTPGVSGLWQVSGRSNTDFETLIRLDLQYIDRWSLGLDFQILLQTLPAVLRGTGAV